jgi:hypothetical protein
MDNTFFMYNFTNTNIAENTANKMVIIKKLLLFIFVLNICCLANAQVIQNVPTILNDTSTSKTIYSNKDTLSISKSDSVTQNTDSTVFKKKNTFFTPKKTAMYTAIVPGLGQIINKQYWKLPIIYGGLGVAGYFIITNTNEYNSFRKIYAGRLNNDPVALSTNPNMSLEEIKFYQDQAKSNLDMTVLFTVLGYGLQIMDALVFAHLKGFDVSEDISMKVGPSFKVNGAVGIGLVLNFK